MNDNFYVYTDIDGKLPQLRRTAWRSLTHRYYVRYVNNKPVECKPHNGQTLVWDYSLCRYIPIDQVKIVQ